jgi:hypothetical protein
MEKNDQMNTVTFATQCYEKDYSFVLDEERLIGSINNNNHDFKEKIVIINISNNYDNIIKKCEDLKSKNIISNYYLVEEHLKDICEHYKISEQHFNDKKSFYINLYNLASIYLSRSDYVVFYTGDSICVKKSDWIKDSIKILESNAEYLNTNLLWCDTPVSEHYSEIDNFYLSKSSFSDQNYMIRRNDFLNPEIIKYKTTTKFFPHGDTFEMRVFGYMENKNKIRCIHKIGKYEHRNFF